jgi:archaellum component FlaF (FlaF/FlaG flagellin family)
LGFSVAAAAAILFAGSLLCFSIVVESVQSAAESVREARARDNARTADRLNTHMALVSGSANGTVVDMNLTNDGSVVVHVRTLEVLVNGTLYTGNITLRTVEGSNATNLWAPGQVLHLVVDAAVAAPAGVKIVADTGFEFFGTVN